MVMVTYLVVPKSSQWLCLLFTSSEQLVSRDLRWIVCATLLVMVASPILDGITWCSSDAAMYL